MELREAAAAMSALAQETRLETFRLLVRAGPAGLPAGALADVLGVPPNTLSFHLSHLVNAGLAAQRREGRSIIYTADIARMNVLLTYLSENCRGDAAQPGACAGAGRRADRRPPARARGRSPGRRGRP